MDTSSISFTAHYTGQVWAKNGLSTSSWQTPLGRFLYRALSPLEWAGRCFVGGDIRTFLLQRHLLIDYLLHQRIQEHPNLQVVEIACGLSPRGLRFCQQHPGLRYIEADLPAMAARKNTLLAQTKAKTAQHYAVPLNFFAEDNQGLASLFAQHTTTEAPVFVITEGLINYFPLDTLAPVWLQLSQLLHKYPKGYYTTDNYPLLEGEPFVALMERLSVLLGWVSRSKVNFHFSNVRDIEKYFQELDFNNIRVHNPADYYETLAIPQNSGTPLVHVISMET